jgi:hypothetical protein
MIFFQFLYEKENMCIFKNEYVFNIDNHAMSKGMGHYLTCLASSKKITIYFYGDLILK